MTTMTFVQLSAVAHSIKKLCCLGLAMGALIRIAIVVHPMAPLFI